MLSVLKNGMIFTIRIVSCLSEGKWINNLELETQSMEVGCHFSKFAQILPLVVLNV
jgi:hypothetical protein